MPNFTDLPRELRDVVYGYYLEEYIALQKITITHGWSRRDITHYPLLSVNKQVGREAATVSFHDMPSPELS